MSLVKVTLINFILGVNETHFPETKEEAVSRWGLALLDYTATIVPASITGAIARSIFEMAFDYSLEAEDGLEVLSRAIKAHAIALAGGMVGFTATAPPGQVDFEPVRKLGLSGGTAEECAELMATIIDDWYRLGTAIPMPTGAMIYWT